VPAAVRLLAEDFHLAEKLYNFRLGDCFLTAFPLEINRMPLRAFENESVGVVHDRY
jgi:hypothetical protein